MDTTEPAVDALTDAAMTGLPPPAVADLARDHGRAVFLAAYRVLGDAAQAEDVQQDVFVRLLEQGSLPAVDSWAAWLSTAAMRLAIDRLRSRRRWWQWLLARGHDEPAAAAPASAHAEQLEQAGQLRRALARLKPREAECFLLRHVQGLDIAEIASALDLTANHVSVTLHRAVRALTRQLSEPASAGQGAVT